VPNQIAGQSHDAERRHFRQLTAGNSPLDKPLHAGRPLIWDLPADMFAPGTGFMYSHAGRSAIVECLANQRTARAFLAFVHPERAP
jgi:hypothetical protein